MEKLKVLELFAGIGACSKALERLGIEHEIVDAVEIDKYAVKSFNAIHNTKFEPQDICTWNKDIKVDLIMHGSPCQDFSLAGKQAGGDEGSGTRSSLMYETIRIVEKLKPKYVIWENVKNLLSKKHKHNFDAYLKTMEQLGYKNYYQVLNAKDYGIPQNRERVFTISILGNESYEFPSGVECSNKIDMVEITQKVKVRKYEVDIEKLKNTLRKHKNISNKSIAESLNKPLTLVEHWFRKDNCFSIPDADIWFSLKKLLNIETNEFDEAITTFEEKDNMYEKSNRFYRDTGLAPTITSTSANEKIIQTFTFPPKQELKLKLKDMLEDEVDEKYYLSEKMIKYISATGTANFRNPDCKINLDIARPLTTDQNKRAGTTNYLSEDLPSNYDLSEPMIYDDRDKGWGVKITDICPTQRAMRTGIKCIYPDLRIRKLTPKECWRLMGFDDEDFEKAAFKKEISYIEGGIKCNARLKIVNEKQRLLDTETYVLCTTNDMLDMETPTQTKWKKSIEDENNEKMQNVNIAIEMLGDVVQKECATNIIKCGENTTILCTLMEELDQHQMAIIGLEKKGNTNIEKYMKITLEENLNPMKLYTISTLIEQIIKSKIYICIAQKANIQGNIAIIEDCVKNLKMMKLSNLKMEYITRLNSDTMLYKQAGNSIVVNVLGSILKELLLNE